MARQSRLNLARLWLGIGIGMAVYIAIPDSNSTVEPLREQAAWLEQLKRIEILHILSHFALFGGVAFLLGDWGGEKDARSLAWRYVLGGTLLMELGQTWVGFRDDTFRDWLLGTAWDVLVNCFSAWLALALLKKLRLRLTSSPASLQ